MSLEIALAENTAAMKELTALLKGAALPTVVVEPARAETPAGEPKAEKPAPEAVPADSAWQPEETAVATEPEASATAPAKLTYDDVAKAVKAAAMRSRAKVLETFASFKIKHASEAKPAQWPALKEALDKITAEAP